LNEEVVFNPWNTCNGNLGELGGMLNLGREEADVKSDFKMTIGEILVNKAAELDQEFFDMAFGKDVVKTEEEYKAKVKEGIAASLIGDSNYRFTLDTQEAIVNHIGDIELPDEFLKEFFLMKDEKATAEKMEEEYPKMKPQLIWQLAKDKIAAEGEIKVEENDLLNIAKLIVTQQFTQYGIYNAPEDAIERQAQEIVKNNEYRRDLANRAVEDKIYAYIRANAKVAEKSVSVNDFNKLFESEK
jgi:trigger factor